MIEKIIYKSGRVLRIIDGEYVIGAGGACKDGDCKKRKIIEGGYVVESDCCVWMGAANVYRKIIAYDDITKTTKFKDDRFIGQILYSEEYEISNGKPLEVCSYKIFYLYIH